MLNQWKPWLTAVLAVVGLSACQEDDDNAGGTDAQVRADGGGAGGEGGVGGGVGGEGGVGGGAGGEGGVGGGAGGEGGGLGGAGGEGGAGNEGGMGGAGGEPIEECVEDLQLRDPCDPEADCCARGLVCVDFGLGTGAQCANVCDSNSDPTGCDLRELCNAFEQVEDPEAPSPGACIPSQECDIDASAVCGDGATCFAAQNITICAPAGDAETGAACEAFPVDEAGMLNAALACREGLTCVAGECAAPCEGDMCGEGLRCVDFTEQLDGQEFSFCFGGCDIFSQVGCEANQTCVWTNTAPTVGSNAGEAMGVCADAPNGMGQQNDACTQSEETYWGTCDHALCTPLGEGDDPTCLAFCDDVNRGDCTDGSVCVRDALGVDLGLCLGNCTFWPAEGESSGCAEGETCGFAFIGLNQAGDSAVSGLCRASTQEHNTGEECELNEDTGENSCVQGHICASVAQNAPVCVKICEIGEGVANGCPPGFQCAEVFEGTDAVGACLEG